MVKIFLMLQDEYAYDVQLPQTAKKFFLYYLEEIL